MNQTRKCVVYFACPETTESKPVKRVTSRTVIRPPTVRVLCKARFNFYLENAFVMVLAKVDHLL